MRLVSVAFWSSNALLALAASFFCWTRLRAAEPVAAPPSRPLVRVTAFRPRELSTTSVERRRGAAGWISFGLPEGESLAGIVGARAFPVEDGNPDLGGGVELAAAQLDGRLDVHEWLARGVPPDAFLSFDLIVRGVDGRAEYRQGWARVDVVSLRTDGVRVEAPARGKATIAVLTRDGDPVPGALLVVDAQDVGQPGLASQYAFTGEDGAVVLSGLDRETTYRASLADGVGPDTRPLAVCVKGDGSRQEVRLALAGKWEFVRHHLCSPAPGTSARLTAVEVRSEGSRGAWAVNRWVPPGRGFDAPLWIMLPASEGPEAVPARIVFNQRDAVDVPDLRREHRLLISPWSKKTLVLGPVATAR